MGNNGGQPRLARVTGAGLALALVVGALVVGPGAAVVAADAPPTGPAPVEQRDESMVTADPLPTAQLDGEKAVAWTQVIAGDTVYVGGSFTGVRPAGAPRGRDVSPRSNLLSYDITTGRATSFAPVINGTVKALAVSPDGRTLYVGGSFTQVDGQARFNLAAFDTATGALTDFRAAIGGSFVNAIVATESTIYVGGLIGAAKGVARKNLAAVSSRGELLGWAPQPNAQVDAMVLAPGGALVIAGRFSTVDGVSQTGLSALDPRTGEVIPWAASTRIHNGEGSAKAGIWGLAADERAVYGTAWSFHANNSNGNLEGAFAVDASTGDLTWATPCRGDHYGVYSDGANVYTTGHAHNCALMGGFPQKNPAPGNMRHAMVYTAAARGTQPASTDSWFQYWNGTPAPALKNWFPDWMTGTATGQGQAGWAITGNGEYVVVGGEFPMVNGVISEGIARFAVRPQGGAKEGPRLSGAEWTPTAVGRGGGAAQVTIPANWDRDDLTLTYEVREQGSSAVVGSVAASATFWNRPQVTVPATGFTPGSTRTLVVTARDGDGNTAQSAPVTVTVGGEASSAYGDAVLRDGASLYWRLGAPAGGTGGGTGGATDWAGSNAAVFGSGAVVAPDGAIVGDADRARTVSGSATGIIRSTSQVTVTPEFATEIWFQTSTTRGGKLLGRGGSASGLSTTIDRHVYMRNDGRLAFGVHDGTARAIASDKAYNDGAWHHVVAQQSRARGMELFVDGELVATDAGVTTAENAHGYWRLGGDTLTRWPGEPSSHYFAGKLDEFAVYPRALAADQVRSHHRLGTDTAPPVAVVRTSVEGLSITADGTASTASGGASIAEYAWDFGDGTASAEPTPTHTYASAGTYVVTLTVTDSRGVRSVAEATEVTVVAPDLPLVSDDFAREVTSGWGDAPVGGAWTAGAGFSVRDGAGEATVGRSQTRTARLAGVSILDSDSRLSLAVDRVADGGGLHVNYLLRSGDAGEYRLKVRTSAAGAVTMSLTTFVAGAEKQLASRVLPGYTLTADAVLDLRVRIATSGTQTRLEAKAWPAETGEPDAWLVAADDATPALAAPGGVGVSAYLTGSATNGPVTVRIGDLRVR